MSLIKALKLRWKFGSLVVLLSLILIGVGEFFFTNRASPPPKCWNDIDFKKTEHLLLTSSVKRMIPFYKYYKDQEIQKGRLKEEIEKEFSYKYNKVKYDNGRRAFVIIFDNGSKAFFKEQREQCSKGSSCINSSLTVYNFSKFFDLKYVPPIVKRELNGITGSLQLFIEQDEGYSKSRSLQSNIIRGLSSETKSSLYGLIFLTCLVDTNFWNVLISKRCLKPVFIDNDWLPVCLAEYSDSQLLFMVRKWSSNLLLSEEDYKKAPLSEKIEFKGSSYDSIKNLFPQAKRNYWFVVHLKNPKNTILYLKYKEAIFFSFPYNINIDLLNISRGSEPLEPVLPPAKFLKKLKKLDRNQIKKISLKDDETWINGILHRRNLILKEAERQGKQP